MPELETERLLLRRWKESDRPAFADMSADPEAMKFLGGVWSRAASDNFIDRAQKHFDDHGYGLYATELKETGTLIGFVGIRNVPFDAHFTPAIEIGWRLGQEFWGQDYATEAASKVLEYGFNHLGLNEIVSFTSPVNVPSWRLMEKLGMISRPEDNFRHPKVPSDDILSEHVLYRLKKEI
ncbi:MAG TPA: GNAT family N-acetyltransferase [Alphaproteobacteria bacterium]|jgi:RimJ/RimL family protein N-acetyltransferase